MSAPAAAPLCARRQVLNVVASLADSLAASAVSVGSAAGNASNGGKESRTEINTPSIKCAAQPSLPDAESCARCVLSHPAVWC